MVDARITIREEAAQDFAAIHEVEEQAFGQSDEADLVDALRQRGAVVLSLVALLDGQVVGHILFTPVSIESAVGTFSAIGLGPMAVSPLHQRRGIGSELVRRGLDNLRAAGHELVVVLGHPDYYPRFGFVPSVRYAIRSEYDVPDDVFMVLELRDGALERQRGGLVRYQPEFGTV